ncbi:unnamed protein product [Prorocentrum cordatum]|uniref:Uncharacterized protein n=1 Tax=Prorocentrum cordatum TaxID=2364126 RepID=A0ABN9WPN2_9DINO|nr:unnamed protein product [Polarella glacialis]
MSRRPGGPYTFPAAPRPSTFTCSRTPWASPPGSTVLRMRISGNALCGVRVYTAATHTEGLAASATSSRGARELALRRAGEAAQRVHGNALANNGEDQCCFTPRFADTEELQLDLEDAEGCAQHAFERPGSSEAFAVFDSVGAEDIAW